MIRTVIVILLLIASLAAEDVLMGYRRLDAAGLPEDVRVALTREALDRLWQRAHPESVEAPPVVDLATGLGRWSLREDDGRILADLAWPVAVLAASWQDLHLPLAGATIRDLRYESDQTMVWTREADRLDLRLPPRSQGIIRATLALTVQTLGDARIARLPLPSGGGDLRMTADPTWKLTVADRPARIAEGTWIADLPLAAACELVWRRRDGGLGQEVRADLDQEVVVTAHADRLEWAQTLDLGLRGGAIRSLRLDLDPRLRLTAVTGQDLASWHQEDGALDLAWDRPRRGTIRLSLAGVIARPDAERGVGASLGLGGATRSGGRIALRRADDPGAAVLRLVVATDPGLRRADPRAGELTAFAWHDAGVAPMVSLSGRGDDLGLAVVAAVVSRDRDLDLHADLRLQGEGIRDALILDLPQPWQLVGTTTDLDLRLVEEGGRRRLILRRPGGLGGGDHLRLHLRIIDAGSDQPLTLPVLTVDGLVRAESTWIFGDDDGRRLRLGDDRPLVGDAARLAHGFGLEGMTWRGAWQQRGEDLPTLRLEPLPQRAQISLSTYLVLEGTRLQASVHGRIQVRSGSLDHIALRLPAGAKVLRARSSQQGGLARDHEDLRFTLATPTRSDLDLDLDLEIPLDEQGRVRMESLRFTGIDVVAQQVALVEDDGHGLVRRQLDGLVPLASDFLPLPVGVDARQITQRWKADLPTWRIDLRRERTTLELGGDGIVTLFDATSQVAADGEIRSRATWHVLNRSRAHLGLTLPPGVELWEVRVDGRSVACRRDEASASLWIPVQPLRAGEAARRVELTWRQAPGRIDRLTPLAPHFTDLRVVQTLWRVVPPPGWVLRRREGSLRRADPSQAEQDRTDRVVEEMRRLRSQGQLQDRALQRCNDNLEALALELKDYASASAAQGNAVQSAAITGQLALLEEDLSRNTSVLGNRSGNRRSLAIGASVRMWKAEARPTEDDALLPWDAERSLERGASLGSGETAPGHRPHHDRHLLGIDLLGTRGGGLSLRGSGTGDVVLALEREQGRRWPWLALGVLVLSVGVALRTWRR